MNPEIPQPIEAEYGVPIAIWEERELTEAFIKMHNLDPYDIDEIVHETLIKKNLRLGDKEVSVLLEFFPLSRHSPNGWNHIYAPFEKDTKLIVNFSSGQTPVVERHPLLFSIIADRNTEEIDISYQIDISGIESIEGKYKRKDYDELVNSINGELRELFLPDDPKILSTMTITFLKGNRNGEKN